MGSIGDIMVLSVGSVTTALNVINENCSSMQEAESACRRLHHRLTNIPNALEKLLKCYNNQQHQQQHLLERYTQTLQTCVQFLQRYSGKPLASRLILQTKIMAELYTLNEDVDVVLRSLDLTVTDDWKADWESNRQAQMRATRVIARDEALVLRECRSARAQAEAMVQLQFQLDRRQRHHSEELLELMRILLATVGKISSNASAPTVPLWFVPRDEVEYDEHPFAGGSFGTVHHGVLGSGAKVVVKVLLLDEGGMNTATMKQFVGEVSIWWSLHHPHVVKMFGASHVTVPPFIVCEAATTNGNLVEFLAASGGNNKSRMWELLYQSALGLEHLHRNQIVHGDLKLNNILVGDDGQARIADFGLSTVKASSRSTQSRCSGSNTPATAAGGLRWRAPECFTRRPTFASDVFSFAMCIIEAATGEPPFAFLDDMSVIVMVRDGLLPGQPEELGDDDWALVQTMAKRVPSERLPLRGVLQALKARMEQERELQRRARVCVCGPQEQASVIDGVCSECYRPRSHVDPQEETVLTSAKSHGRSTKNNASETSLPLPPQLTVDGSSRPQPATTRSALANLSLSSCTVAASKPAQIAQLVDALASSDETQRANAAQALAELARDPPTTVLIAQAGTIAKLLSLLRSDTPTDKQWAAFLCARLAVDHPVKRELVDGGGVIPILVGLVRSGTDLQKQYAATALGHLASYYPAEKLIVNEGGIPPLVALVRNGSDDAQKEAAAFALGNLTVNFPTKNVVSQEGGVAPLVTLVGSGTEAQREAATFAIANLCNSLGNNGVTAIVPLVVLLRTKGKTDFLKEQATRALAYIAKSNDANRVAICDAGGVDALVEVMRKGNQIQQGRAAYALAQLAEVCSVAERITSAGGKEAFQEWATNGNQAMKGFANEALRLLSGGSRRLFKTYQSGPTFEMP